jgi:hypothetical protein
MLIDAAQTLCSHTEEARLARGGKITYKEALHTIYDRKHALSNAMPFSARVVGQGDSFLFRQGVLCVLAEKVVQVTDLHFTANTIFLDLPAILSSLHYLCSPDSSVILMNYSDHILAVHVMIKGRPNYSHLCAISTDRNKPDNERVLGVVQLQESSKLFVRHTARYLYYGTHTGMGADGHHKWEIFGISLNSEYALPRCQQQLLLEDFHGTDIGSTVAFEIYNDCFHAVSNQGTYQVEEVDWTSFYHCIRFPLNNPVPEAVERDARVYRRQHDEGPIHDSWTDLTLQLDERTNETVIVESRREWLRASSRQARTFYTSPFQASPTPSSIASPPAGPSSERVLPENDIYVTLLDSSSNANYMPTPPQHSRNRHPEFSKGAAPQRSFILARTKFRAYNYSASTFLDMVEDEGCCNDVSTPCLRLRVGSRSVVPSSPVFSSSRVTAPVKHPAEHTVKFVDSTQYRHSPISMWPPPRTACPCSARLHKILNPSPAPGSRRIEGVLDNQFLVYMVQTVSGYAGQASPGTIVCVNFSRQVSADSTGEGPCTPEDPLHWKWELGQHRHCAAGTCR